MELFTLLIVFQFKHFIADYPLQNEYMLGKFKNKGWILPLAYHCVVHAILTYGISLLFKSELALMMSIFDFSVHFIMDRIKASPKMLGKYNSLSKSDFLRHNSLLESYKKKGYSDWVKDLEESFELDKKNNKLFWWSLGIDQMVHHLTHYLIIYLLTR